MSNTRAGINKYRIVYSSEKKQDDVQLLGRRPESQWQGRKTKTPGYLHTYEIEFLYSAKNYC
jgi:hypothetical protein